MQLVYPPNYIEPLAAWPNTRVAVPMARCAVTGCSADKTIERRGGMEVMRCWCQEHAVAYDVECMRRRTPAPVFDLFTGERVA